VRYFGHPSEAWEFRDDLPFLWGTRTLDDETAARIVAYLQTHYGQSETASTASRK